MLQLCSRCHKRVAVVFVTKIENGQRVNDGICLQCARELGIKPINDMLDKIGMGEEDIDRLESEMQSLIPENGDEGGTGESDPGRITPIDFGKLFGQLGTQGGAQQNPGQQGADAQQGKKRPDKQPKKRRYLDEYCQSLTKKALEGRIDNIVGRERETARVMQILSRRQKNNPCLIGEAGVGKTAIAEALAAKIASCDCPAKLRGKEVCLVDMTAMVAGTQFRGQFEARMKGLITDVKDAGNVILVIDEIHSIVGVGDAEGSMNAANILKPALSRGEIQIIGATTLAEYRKYIEKDAALERRFQPVIVNEPSVAETVEILKGVKKYYEAYHNVIIPDDIATRAALLSERYITDRYLPDKAIDLIDEAAAYVAMHSKPLERSIILDRQLQSMKEEQQRLEGETPDEKDEAAKEQFYEKAAKLKADILSAEQEREQLKGELGSVAVDVNALAQVIEVWTGIPAQSITENEYERLGKLADRLKKRIVGQDDAVNAVAGAIKRSRAGVSAKRKPTSFIFAGPTGVGKTELVKVLANDLFSSPESLIRLDMSEFMEKHSVAKLIGSPPGYVGYDDAGQLTEKIRRKPYSVVLFDEIEKAHPDVLNIMLQILDDGRITDAHGKEVNFENTVIVMTTNAGSTNVTNTAGFGQNEKQIGESRTEKALSEFLRPEFLNRVDEVITFRHLSRDDFKAIAKIMLGDFADNLADRGIKVSYSDSASAKIAEDSYSEKYGARNMRRYIREKIEDAAAEKIINSYGDPITVMAIDTDENGNIVIITD